MSKKRNGSTKKRIENKHLPNGYLEFQFAKDYIVKGNTEAVIGLLEKLLTTNCRLSAALELLYFYFQKQDIMKFQEYFQILIQEESNKEILNQVKRMCLYLKVKLQKEEIDRTEKNYVERQIIGYREEEMRSFIKQNRCAIPNKLEDNKFLYFWNPDTIIDQVNNNLNKKYVCHTYDAIDYYYVQAEKNGIANDKISSTIEVATIRDTLNIIDMKPSEKDHHRRLLIPKFPMKFDTTDSFY